MSERSLRYYEEQGLLEPGRAPGGHRTYAEWPIDRVVDIQELYAAGLPSVQIRALLPCMRDHDGGPAATATPWLTAELRAHRSRLEHQMAALRSTRDVLDDVIRAAEGASQNDLARESVDDR